MIQLTQADVFAIQDAVVQTMLSEGNPGEKYRAANELYTVYAAITGVTADTSTDSSMTLPTGIAISASAAAHCLREFARSSAFLRGIQQAIKDLQKLFPGERLRILYAGCGPYAALVTPLLRLYQPTEIGVDLLDITPRSIEAVKYLYKELGLTDYVNQYLLCDATTYQITGEQPMHLLISETLNAGLKNEPYVSIMQNLVPQLPVNAIVIPQQVTVDAMYFSISEEMQHMTNPEIQVKRLQVAKLANFNSTTLQTPAPVSFTVPPIDPVKKKLHLVTTIDVYRGEMLKPYDCSLTLPMRVKLTDAVPGDEIRFTYVIGEKPGFVPQVIKQYL
jgi:hypothetical protein